jgi:hypothetical protein
MRGEVEQLFLGKDDAYVGIRVPNRTPSTFYNFRITDPEALAAAIDLPAGQQLAKVRLFDGGPEAYYLTLAVSRVEDDLAGTRAEWSVYADDGSGHPHRVVIDLMTADVGIDPVDVIHLPGDVRHRLADGEVRTRLSSDTIAFDASFETAGATDQKPTLDWVESVDHVCATNGVCDDYYYDAETLDVAVHRPAAVTVDRLSTPWNRSIDTTPSIVFYRDNAQGYVVKRWQNLKVPVDAAEVAGLEGATHRISGSGTLVGRTSDVANSTYTYRGDAVVEGDELRFSIDQKVDNVLGTSHIYTSGTFSLETGKGTQTVVDCQGPALMCSDIEAGSEAPFEAQGLDASDRDAITWKVAVSLDLGSSYGMADSASTFTATRKG